MPRSTLVNRDASPFALASRSIAMKSLATSLSVAPEDSPTDDVTLPLLTLALAQYPILGGRMRAAMRRELFQRGIITPQAFETRTREMAIKSQEQEGLRDPLRPFYRAQPVIQIGQPGQRKPVGLGR